MTDKVQYKFLKTFISFVATFLAVIIIVLILRALTLNIETKNNSAHNFMKDYFDVMLIKTENILSKFKIRKNSVSEYQINLMSQSVNDYINLSKYQMHEIGKDFNPSVTLSTSSIDKYKEQFYKMVLENPYVLALTFFNNEGEMKLNLFSVKGFTLNLTESLMDEVKQKQSLVLHSDNENILYIITHMQNEHGSYYMAIRNDYLFVTDMISYYQIADKNFILTDSHSISQKINESDIVLIDDSARDNVASIISRYAYYKEKPAFVVGDKNGLEVTMISKNYPNYLEIALIFFTALLLVAAQRAIMLVIHLIKKAFAKNSVKELKPIEEVKAKKRVLPFIQLVKDKEAADKGIDTTQEPSYS